jgi:hypothetical protein
MASNAGTHSLDMNSFRHIENRFNNRLQYTDLAPILDKRTIFSEAENVMDHRFEIFGIKTDYGPNINYHFDPKSGKTWPLRFWNDIKYRDGKKLGGIKFAWELNRLHHWPQLSIAYCLTEDKRYLKEIFTELDGWLKSNRYPFGINWISGIELGIRLVNLFYSLKIAGARRLGRLQKELVLQFFSIHGRHLYRYPSKYTSCANHALAEALGLFVAGLIFPSTLTGRKWKTMAKKILDAEVTRQIYPDGSSFEHTIPYLQFVTDHFLIYYLLCKEYREDLNANIEERLKAICSFISCIIDTNGNVPMIGDDDDGYLLKLWFGEHNNFFSILNTCSVLFERPEWIHPHSSLDAKTMLLLGSSAGMRWEKLKSEQAWKRKSCYFDDAGLAVIVDLKSGKEILFIGNSGPLGLEPLSGHGHADALSFWLSIDGKPFFVDPGTYLYHSGGKWRRYFRSTAAHNTVQIDNQDQAEQISDFMFRDFYQINNIIWSEREDRIEWGAEHTGYQRLASPVVHRREVTYMKRTCSFEIVDSLRCGEKHDVKLFFHFHPNVKVLSNGENTFRLTQGNSSVVLRVDKQLKVQAVSGSKNPLMGWYSPGFNRLEKTVSLVFSKEIAGDSVFKSEVAIL